MKVDYSFIERIIREDSQLMVDDAKRTPLYGNPSSDKPIIADFTEYSPLHKGHRHCMFEAKKRYLMVCLWRLSQGLWSVVGEAYHI